MSFSIIIWGPDNYNALGLLRQLAPSNLPILFLMNGQSKGCATKSIYCKSIVQTNSYEDGLNFLLKNVSQNSKNILIPIGDKAAETIDVNRNKLLRNFYLMGTEEEGLLRSIDNKNNMVALAEESGFLVPESFRFSLSSQDRKYPMPCILKPTIGEGVKEFKTKIFRTKSELENFKKYLNPHNEYIIQELISKTHDILVYGCRFPNGKIELAGQFIKDRWSDDGGGSHGFLTDDLPEYICKDAISKFLNKINYSGLFSVEYGLINNKAYFYEFNLRNDGTSHLFYQAGANLPLAWVNYCLGADFKCSTKITKPGWNINEIYDISNVFHGTISFKTYKKDKSGASIFHYYDPSDMEPWKYARKKALFDLPLRAFLLKFRPQLVLLKKKIQNLYNGK